MMFTPKIWSVIAIIPAIALALVLVTPDPTDDVDGILHLSEQEQSQPQELLSLIDASSFGMMDLFVNSGSNLRLPPFLPLLCKYRC